MKTVSHEPAALMDAKVLELWTEERRMQAVPKPLPQYVPQGIRGEESSLPKGPPKVIPPNTSAKDALKAEFQPRANLANPVTDPADFPYRCNGKLYFDWNGRPYVGSAGSIFLEVLLTAAHNVYDEGEWSENFLYYPAYPDYEGQFWSWSRAAIFTAWRDNENFAYDYAMLKTNKPMKDIGSMGVICDLSPASRDWTAYGYPAAAPYPGDQMYETSGSYVSGQSIITMNNNDMTQGSSGGNWITQYKGQNYVNGVQSTRGGQASYANSPYLVKSDFDDLLKRVETGN